MNGQSQHAKLDPVVGDPALTLLKEHLETYRHHFDLFIKGIALYWAIVGAMAGYMYAEGVTLPAQTALSIGIIWGSALAAAGCVVSRRWLLDHERVCDQMADGLDTPRFPFSGAKGVLVVMLAAALAVAVASLLHLFVVLY